ncbi:MAG: UvrD-helicase domain-containing protein [Parcubacteria group bacterium]|nr:UvrD-helicase domain-containing protein [Parcubacteria group bacterium]
MNKHPTQESSGAIFHGLNTTQEKAVRLLDGPVLVFAGAGSGKTKVLTHRIANLVASGIPPSHILAITFTNKAAEEMRSRTLRLLTKHTGYSPSAVNTDGLPWIGTFHALGVWLLRREGSVLDIPRQFSILDEEDTLALIKESLKELGISPEQFQPAKMRAFISGRKNELVSPEEFLSQEETFFVQTVGRIWERFEEKKSAQHRLDFDDLLVQTVALFQKHPEALRRYQQLWRYVHIDEYQDTNHAQYMLANLLAQEHKNICVVGDVDQAIYSWRNADFRNILNFERDYPNAAVITLEKNYRSTKTILDAANAIIVKNKMRKPKNLFTENKSGERIRVFCAQNEQEEGRLLAELIQHLLGKGIPATHIAVLYRTNFQSRAIEEALLLKQIPYQVLGVKFYDRKEIKDVLAYLKAALNPRDLLSIKRAINTPSRGIGKVTQLRYCADAAQLNAAERRKVAPFNAMLVRIRETAHRAPVSTTLRVIADITGYRTSLKDNTEEGETRLANIQELIALSKRYDTLPPPEGAERILEEAALMSEQDNDRSPDSRVRLMTVHAAKGLEFPYVFISGMEEGLFPHARGISSPEEREEERRLFYVALTRAKEALVLSWALFRSVFGERQVNEPSSFLTDIPEELLAPAETDVVDVIDAET